MGLPGLSRGPGTGRRYCARQERAHQEVRDKLYGWGLYRGRGGGPGHPDRRGFLNEQRFAEAYALGKFRQKGWGRLQRSGGAGAEAGFGAVRPPGTGRHRGGRSTSSGSANWPTDG